MVVTTTNMCMCICVLQPREITTVTKLHNYNSTKITTNKHQYHHNLIKIKCLFYLWGATLTTYLMRSCEGVMNSTDQSEKSLPNIEILISIWHMTWPLTPYRMLLYVSVSQKRKLEAQWNEPVMLTCHFALRKFDTEPSIGASYQISINLAKWFERSFFSNWPITSKNCLWWPY